MKKCITISLIFCMLLALASCGKTDTSSPENSISIDTEYVEESEEAEYSESEQSEYTESEEEFITVDGSTIKNATGYHNGYNYVTFYDGTSAVFDKEGISCDIRNTICYATRERQESCAELASRVDAMIVIGDEHSSNSRKLYERRPLFQSGRSAPRKRLEAIKIF